VVALIASGQGSALFEALQLSLIRPSRDSWYYEPWLEPSYRQYRCANIPFYQQVRCFGPFFIP
jgi:hypothetical protein